MKRRIIALGVGLLAGTYFPAAVAAPPSETWFSSCEGPIATCEKPHPSSAIEEIRSIGMVHGERLDSEPQRLRLPETLQHRSPGTSESRIAAPTTDIPDGPQPIPDAGVHEARAVLWQWQAATQTRLPASKAERLRLAHERPDLTGQERAIAHEFQGPIDAEALWEHYEWSVAWNDGDRFLTAIPRGTLDRLLCERIEIRLDENWRLAAITFADGRGAHRATIARAENRHVTAKIITADYTSEASGAPQPRRDGREAHPPELLRTAALEEAVELSPVPAEEVPRLLRIEGELSLPPAPVEEITPENGD